VRASHSCFGSLEKEPWISESAVFGDGLHVIGKEGADLEREIRILFGKHGILLKRAGTIRPSLEDVFVSLIEKRIRMKVSRAWAIAKKSLFISTGIRGAWHW